MSETKVICPACGAEMNQHAVKIDYGVDDSKLIDPVFGGALKSAHTCPGCGHMEFRAVSPNLQQS